MEKQVHYDSWPSLPNMEGLQIIPSAPLLLPASNTIVILETDLEEPTRHPPSLSLLIWSVCVSLLQMSVFLLVASIARAISVFNV